MSERQGSNLRTTRPQAELSIRHAEIHGSFALGFVIKRTGQDHLARNRDLDATRADSQTERRCGMTTGFWRAPPVLPSSPTVWKVSAPIAQAEISPGQTERLRAMNAAGQRVAIWSKRVAMPLETSSARSPQKSSFAARPDPVAGGGRSRKAPKR